jgi:DNA-binding CsgD family transcriptional regulator
MAPSKATLLECEIERSNGTDASPRSLQVVPTAPARSLTPRQLARVVLLANGHRAEEIGAILSLSVSSVEKTIAKARSRAGARTIAHLVSISIASGLLEWSPERRERYVNGGDTNT